MFPCNLLFDDAQRQRWKFVEINAICLWAHQLFCSLRPDQTPYGRTKGISDHDLDRNLLKRAIQTASVFGYVCESSSGRLCHFQLSFTTDMPQPYR